MNSKRGTSSKIGLLNEKVSYNEKSPYNFTYLGNILVKENVINSKRNQEIVVTIIWLFAFFDDKTINFKGIEEKVT